MSNVVANTQFTSADGTLVLEYVDLADVIERIKTLTNRDATPQDAINMLTVSPWDHDDVDDDTCKRIVTEYYSAKGAKERGGNSRTTLPIITKIGDFIAAIQGDGADIVWNDVLTSPDGDIINPTHTAMVALCYRQKTNDEYRKEVEPPYADIDLSDDEILAAIRGVDADDYEGFDDETMRLSAWQDYDDARLQAINQADIKKHGPLAGRLRGKEHVPAISAQGTVNANALTNKAHDIASKLEGNNELPAVFDEYYKAKIGYKTTAGKMYNILTSGDNPLLDETTLLAMPEPGTTKKDIDKLIAEGKVPAGTLYDRIVFTAGEKQTVSFYSIVIADLPFGKKWKDEYEGLKGQWEKVKSHENKRLMNTAKYRFDSAREVFVKAVKIGKQCAAIHARKAQWRVEIADLLNTQTPVMIFDDEGKGIKGSGYDSGAAYFTIDQLLRFEPAKAGLDANGKLSILSLAETLKRPPQTAKVEFTDVAEAKLGVVAMSAFFHNNKKLILPALKAPKSGDEFKALLVQLRKDIDEAIRNASS